MFVEKIFVPIVTTEAGSTLTPDNWRAVNAQCLGFSLNQLLMKPGQKILSNLMSLKKFVGWDRQVVLDASLSFKKNSETFMVHSTYDGRKHNLSMSDFVILINQLKPDYLILPEVPVSLNNQIESAITDEILLLSKHTEDGIFSGQGQQNKEILIYLSNQPAKDGYAGEVYTQNGMVDIKREDHKQSFELMCKVCKCPTCQQKMTRAYLHHLIHQTPLLCQRFLIMHNIWHSISSQLSEAN